MPRSLRPGVLIVEDEEELLSLVSRIFESEDYKIFQARDGAAAIEIYRRHQEAIDVVLTDLGLPGVGGADVIAAIRGLNSSVKIVGLSGYGGGESRMVALAAGADMFCEKPFAVDELLESIRRLLSPDENRD